MHIQAAKYQTKSQESNSREQKRSFLEIRNHKKGPGTVAAFIYYSSGRHQSTTVNLERHSTWLIKIMKIYLYLEYTGKLYELSFLFLAGHLHMNVCMGVRVGTFSNPSS